VGPYFALIPEIAWSQGDRLRLSQLMQLASLPLLALLSAWGVGLDLGRRAGVSATVSVQWLVVGLSLLALLLCLAPIFAVNEGRHARGTRSELAFLPALRATLRNRPYMTYLLAQIFFVLGINLVQPLFPYLATVALGRSEGFTLWFTAAAGAGIALGFALQRPVVARFGPKRVMMGCIGLAALAVAALGLLRPDVPGGPHDRANLLLCFGGFFAFGVPAAGLMVLPHVLISQLIDEDERRTGATRAAMFFGVQGLLTKWVYGLSTWCLAFLLARYGNSPEEPLGVLLVGPVAAVLCLLSLCLYAFYPEARVLAGARREPPAPDPAAG
jgi:GPH family glycoside/pentoside/hexuronide:cation symporter